MRNVSAEEMKARRVEFALDGWEGDALRDRLQKMRDLERVMKVMYIADEASRILEAKGELLAGLRFNLKKAKSESSLVPLLSAEGAEGKEGKRAENEANRILASMRSTVGTVRDDIRYILSLADETQGRLASGELLSLKDINRMRATLLGSEGGRFLAMQTAEELESAAEAPSTARTRRLKI